MALDDNLPEISTRLAREDDLPVLAVFERELARLAFPQDPITDLAYHEAKLRRALRAEPQGLVVLTTDDDHDIVGWLWVTTKRTLATGEHYGVLRSLYVRHDLRRQGLATALGRYGLRYLRAQGVRRVVAKIHIDNEAAQRTLERLGFEALHLTCEWRGGEDDPPMTRNRTDSGGGIARSQGGTAVDGAWLEK
ncbi:MAG: GNAT family N-acetyltransferase [Armatimonadetes bacterium]|nr:GNAT family N-acetyltransferase [Armatimonadota bacterium]